MVWKIVFTYADGGKIKISNNKKQLSKELAEKYQKQYAKPSNDGGVVYISTSKTCKSVALQNYIDQKGKDNG